MTDEECIEIVEKIVQDTPIDEVDKVLKDLPMGELVTKEVEVNGKTKMMRYTQMTKATLKVLHGVDIEEEIMNAFEKEEV